MQAARCSYPECLLHLPKAQEVKPLSQSQLSRKHNFLHRPRVALRSLPRYTPVTRASSSTPPDDNKSSQEETIDDAEFEAKLARLRKKSGSGTGKKAEIRKARKDGSNLESDVAFPPSTPKAADKKPVVMLPPIPLQDPIVNGVPFRYGFSSYTEKLHGNFAAVGLAALLSVELYTGGSLLNYHDGVTLMVQLYVILAVAALLVKLDKEKNSVWPQ